MSNWVSLGLKGCFRLCEKSSWVGLGKDWVELTRLKVVNWIKGRTKSTRIKGWAKSTQVEGRDESTLIESWSSKTELT